MHTLLQSRNTLGIVIGIVFGIVSRLLMLRTDYRQYPTYPHGKIIHIALGVIASALGAVAVPALLDKNYTAITFLTLAAQQFREVRNMERNSLKEADKMELVPRGTSYIEGIAMVFEGRNYLVIFSSLFSSFCSILLGWYWGIAAGIIALFITKIFQRGKNLGEIADIRAAEVRVDGPDIYVDSTYIMNVGLEQNQRLISKYGYGLIVRPKTPDAKVTIANLGQRQAILHNLSIILGVYRDSGEPGLIPMAKLNLETGELGVFILPNVKEPEQAVEVLKHVPVLESAIRMPTESSAKKEKP